MCLCNRAALTWSHVGCSQLSSVISMLAGTGGSSGFGYTDSHIHTNTCRVTHTCTCPLLLPLSVFVLPLADFFCGQQMGWHRITRTQQVHSVVSRSVFHWHLFLSVHLNVLTSSLCCNPFCVEMTHQLFFSVVYQTKIPNVRQIQPFRVEDPLCLMRLYMKYLWSLDKTRHLETSKCNFATHFFSAFTSHLTSKFPFALCICDRRCWACGKSYCLFPIFDVCIVLRNTRLVQL